MNRLTLANAAKELESADTNVTELFSHGSLVIEYYKPDGIDLQQPHSMNELYFVASGSGYFVNGSSRQPFKTGKVLFVPAGAEHQFENFTP